MCNCKVSNCGGCNGIPLVWPTSEPAPHITGIIINPDNTLSLTMSNGDTITSYSSINIPNEKTSYIAYQDSTPSFQHSFAIPNISIGDLVEINVRGTLDNNPGATPLVSTINGVTRTLFSNPSILTNSQKYVDITTKIARVSANTVRIQNTMSRGIGNLSTPLYTTTGDGLQLLYDSLVSISIIIGQQINSDPSIIPNLNFVQVKVTKYAV